MNNSLNFILRTEEDFKVILEKFRNDKIESLEKKKVGEKYIALNSYYEDEIEVFKKCGYQLLIEYLILEYDKEVISDD